MNRLAGSRIVRTFALVAAAAFALAPVDLLASCRCSGCGCVDAEASAEGCCCDSESCEAAAPSASCCDATAATPQSAGCLCLKTAPPAPTATTSSHQNSPRIESVSLIVATTPLASECDPLAGLTASSDQPLAAAVPLRILLRVWRI